MDFKKENYREFKDVNNTMKELFGVSCSLCGYDEISFVAENTPKEVGLAAEEIYERSPDISDLEMENALEEILDAWQQVDDYNAENLTPTFLCYDCYEQLKNNEIKVSDFNNIEEK